MSDGYIPPIVTNFVSNYADAVAGAQAVADSFESIGPAAEAASAEASASLDTVSIAMDRLDGQMSLFREEFSTVGGGQFALFADSAEEAATTVEESTTEISASVESMSIAMAGARAKWVADCAEIEATTDAMVANLEAADARAAAATEAVGTAGMKTATIMQEGMMATGTKMMSMGATVTAVSGAMIAIFSDMAGNFQQKMTLIQTNAHDSTDSIQAMGQAVLQMAPQVDQTPENLADALYHIASVGLRGKAALDVLHASAEDATIGVANLEDVTYAMSGVMSIAMPDIKNAADGVAMLNDIVGQGDMRMQDLTNAIGTGVLPVFKNAGLGMKDFGAALTTLTDNSTPAEVAANHLKTSIMLLQNQSAPAATALNELGLRDGELASDISKPGGLLVAVMDLKTHIDNFSASTKGATMSAAAIDKAVAAMAATLTAQGASASEQKDELDAYRQSLEHMGTSGVVAAGLLAKAFGGARSAATMETLIEETGKLQSKYNDMGTQASRAAQQQKDWTATQDTFKAKLAGAKAGLDSLGISIGQYLLPVVTKILGAFASFAHFLSVHQGLAKALAIVLGGALLLGVTMLTAGFVMLAIAIQGTPIGWIFDIGVAIVAIVAAIVANWSSVVGFFRTVWTAVTALFQLGIHRIDAIVGWFAALPGRVMGWFNDVRARIVIFIGAAVASIGKWIDTTAEKVGDFFTKLPGRVKDWLAGVALNIALAEAHILDDIGSWVSGIATKVGTFFSSLPGKIGNWFNQVKSAIWAEEVKILVDVGTWITGIWGKITGFFGNIGNKIGAFFSGAGSWLFNAGSDVIHGLLSGIENAASWLWTQLKNFAGNVVNHVLSFFGISSPAKTMEPVGEGINLGIAHYLSAHSGKSVAAAQALTRQVVGALSGAGSFSMGVTGGSAFNGSASSAGGAGGVNIGTVNLNGNLLTNQSLRQLVLELFQQRGQRNGSTQTFPSFRLGN